MRPSNLLYPVSEYGPLTHPEEHFHQTMADHYADLRQKEPKGSNYHLFLRDSHNMHQSIVNSKLMLRERQ